MFISVSKTPGVRWILLSGMGVIVNMCAESQVIHLVVPQCQGFLNVGLSLILGNVIEGPIGTLCEKLFEGWLIGVEVQDRF